MIDFGLLTAVLVGVAVLIFLILYFKIQPFLALLIASISVGLMAGMGPLDVLASVQDGMAGTLGFIAIVVGLGAMLGAILENSGGIQTLAASILKGGGENKVSFKLMFTGFLVSIPVFFDVGVVLLMPVVYALQRKTGKSLLKYGIPLVAGLAITHAFVPPTPGPVAVANILGADMGWVIVIGIVAGIPAAFMAGPFFGNFIARRINITAPDEITHAEGQSKLPSVALIVLLLAVPLILIFMSTLAQMAPMDFQAANPNLITSLRFIGHPFSALIIANLLVWYILGLKKGSTKKELLAISNRSLEPAGLIILVTGAGGVFKEILTQTEAGLMIADFLMAKGMNAIFFGYLAAAAIRLLQGSSTVAMITSAGMTAAVLAGSEINSVQLAASVIAIAAGASIYSHVNDSGFWLVSKYFGMTEKQTLKSWSIMTTIVSLVGFAVSLLAWSFA
ncbi:gluconate:H+ symporter [Litoribacter alkaliphilus]|uniref:Gluconate:H+ symporter n=1 Tax=Litoribacter ruber TaxID=702568 RepID=A0AAP2CKE8_9BACT|nr:gluconate:H+ symporter [Litoribacter alkaliphilus]MBS9525399.1 gluconate:H+ symporter [Litoribacter alkaliphilus]